MTEVHLPTRSTKSIYDRGETHLSNSDSQSSSTSFCTGKTTISDCFDPISMFGDWIYENPSIFIVLNNPLFLSTTSM